MSRIAVKSVRLWAASVLPVLLLRALIPVGFMPEVGPGYSVHLVVCDSYAPLPWTSAPRMHMPAGMPMEGVAHQHGGAPAHHAHDTCPYGSGPALGAAPTLAILPASIERPAELHTPAPQIVFFALSPRAQSPRGPPV